MASDDDEYVPSDLDEEAFLQQAYATDEEAYLQGATTGGALATRAAPAGTVLGPAAEQAGGPLCGLLPSACQAVALVPDAHGRLGPAFCGMETARPATRLGGLPTLERRRCCPGVGACRARVQHPANISRGLAAAAADEEDDEEGPEFFGEGADPMALLTSMQEREAAGHQPYELLAARKRRNRRERRSAAAALEAAEDQVGGGGACQACAAGRLPSLQAEPLSCSGELR